MAHKNNTQNKTKTRRSPKRNRHLEKNWDMVFVVMIIVVFFNEHDLMRGKVWNYFAYELNAILSWHERVSMYFDVFCCTIPLRIILC